MEKIIVAIRTLNDNLKIVATKVEDLEKRVDAIAARVDGVGGSLTDSIHNLSAQTEARLAELTERVYALENATPAIADGGDDIGDALDDILGGVLEETVLEEPTPTPTSTVVEEKPTAPTPKPTTVVEEKPTMCPNVDEFIAECLGQTVAPTPTPTVAPTPTPTEKKTPAKTKAVVASAVQRRAYARQYMVEHGAKVEDLRSPAKIEEVMQTEEFQKWVAAR